MTSAMTAAGAGISGVFDAGKGEYVLPPLPYDYAALEPALDAATLKLHHDLHHAGYVKGANTALAKLAEARKSGDFGMVKHWSRELAFHGSGHLLHALFWQNLAPPGKGGGGEPPVGLATLLCKHFGSVEAFRQQLSAATVAVEGSGWGVLAREPASGMLLILQAEKHQDLAVQGAQPVLVIDAWEHAYYLKYQNRRADFVKAFWEVVNWGDVARRLGV